MIISFSFILGLFVIFSLFMLISNYNVSSKRELLEYSRKTIDLIRLIRLNDRNFYLTWDKKYSMDNIDLIRKVRVNLNNIIKKDRSEAVVSRVKSINNLLSSYNDSFERVVDLSSQRRDSYDGNGILDEIDLNYERIKKSFGNNKEYLLKWYRIHSILNEYLTKKDRAKINEIGINLIELQQDKGIRSDERLYLSITSYADLIYNLLSIDSKIEGEEAEFKEYIVRLEKIINDYMTFLTAYVDGVVFRSILVSVIVVILLIATIIFSGTYTVYEILKPIRIIYRSTSKIKDVTKTLSNIVEKKAATSMRVTNSIDGIRKLINLQNESILKSRRAITKMVEHIGNISGIASSKKMSITEMRRNIELTGGQLNAFVNTISDIKKTQDDMVKIVDLVSSISDKTRILAVNAGIEASNAGDFGFVLKIVAREIKTLSAQVGMGAKEIGSLMARNLKTIDYAVAMGHELKAEFDILHKEIDNNAVTTIELITGISGVNNETTDVKYQLERLIEVAQQVEITAADMTLQSDSMRESIRDLIKVKSQTSVAINNIVDNINSLTDDHSSGRRSGSGGAGNVEAV